MASISLIAKPVGEKKLKEVKTADCISYDHVYTNCQQNISILNLIVYKKNQSSWSSGIYSRYPSFVEHSKVNCCDPPHQQTK